MKTQFALASLLISSLITVHAGADSSSGPKPVTRIDFNKMIDENNNTKGDLEKTVSNKMDHAASSETSTSDKSKVMDFVDVEIGLGEDRPVVDRRFNSVGEPRMATDVELNVSQPKEDFGSGT